MIHLRLILALWASMLWASLLSASAATWYLNSTASGANNGTSWANAWQNPTNVVWGGAGVVAGDTLKISGGTTSKNYTNSLICTASGTSGSYIKIQNGQEAGHNGVAIFDNAKLTHSGSAQWVWIDGARDPAFVAPTNHQQVAQGSTAITNNTGFWVKSLTETNPANTQVTDPCLWQVPTGQNLRYSWVEVSGMTNVSNPVRGSVFYASRGGTMTNIIFEYLYFRDNAGQQFASTSDNAVRFGEKEVRFCWIQRGGDDHFEIGGGWTIRDSIIGECYAPGGYVDFFQCTGNYFKIYNNDIREAANAVVRYQTQGDGTNGSYSRDFQFFNNVLTEKEGRAVFGGTRNEFIQFVRFDSQPQNGTFSTCYSNLLIANNLFYNSVSNNQNGTWEICRTAVISFSKGQYVTNAQVYNMIFANNLVIDKEKGVSLPATTNANATTGFWTYTTNDVWADYNTHASTNAYRVSARVLMVLDEDVLDGSSAYTFSNNTNYPAFTDKANDDFELLATDTVALNTGYDLSAYFDFDALNRPRDVFGAWDRGPLELQDEGLIVHLTFEDDWQSAAYVLDQSGNGNHGHRKGNTAFPNSTTNWPERVAASTVPGTNATGYAAKFAWTTNSSYSAFNREGAYLALTNGAALTNLTTATFALWCRYEAGYDGSYLSSHASTLISAGGGAAGKESSWNFGRNNSPQTRFAVLTNISGSSTRDFNFPDENLNTGDTTNWNHYAVTWSNGVINLYFNGTNCATGDVSGTTAALNIGMNGGELAWLALGVNHHGGDWDLNDAVDDYPNNGWLRGYLDDIRIYNRALGAGDILAVYQDAFDAPEGSGGGQGVGSSNAPRLSPKFRNFRAFRP